MALRSSAALGALILCSLTLLALAGRPVPTNKDAADNILSSRKLSQRSVTGKPFRRLLDRSHPGSYYQEKELDNRFVLPSPDPLLEEAFEKFEAVQDVGAKVANLTGGEGPPFRAGKLLLRRLASVYHQG